MSTTTTNNEINAEPTKSFFVDMLVRDIPLEQAILDLVDNSVDGAKSLVNPDGLPFDGREIKIDFSKEKFKIWDNCGGFDSKVAAEYAFRFGRPNNTPRTPHSIGQFGVGMKRALFKFGSHFIVRSSTKDDSWQIDIDVPTWESEAGWTFPWGEFNSSEEISTKNPGTEIIVDKLRAEVAWKFSTIAFQNAMIGLIKSKHRQFIADGLSIQVNGNHIDASSLLLLTANNSNFRPGFDEFTIEEEGKAEVRVKIIVGIGFSSPREAGWYVVCNGRVILDADRRSATGWGLVEESTDGVAIPSFHNQFARFRGIVMFDSDDSSRVPWNTTKTDIDQDGPVWQRTFSRMTEMMRPVINFLNELDRDIDEHTREHSPLLRFVNTASTVKHDVLPRQNTNFAAPERAAIAAENRVKTVKVQYSRPVEDVNFLMKELNLGTAKAVGEKTFDLIMQQMDE